MASKSRTNLFNVEAPLNSLDAIPGIDIQEATPVLGGSQDLVDDKDVIKGDDNQVPNMEDVEKVTTLSGGDESPKRRRRKNTISIRTKGQKANAQLVLAMLNIESDGRNFNQLLYEDCHRRFLQLVLNQDEKVLKSFAREIKDDFQMQREREIAEELAKHKRNR